MWLLLLSHFRQPNLASDVYSLLEKKKKLILAQELHKRGYNEKALAYSRHSINVCWIALEDCDMHPGVIGDFVYVFNY